MKTSGIITLTTDFGLSDAYTASMKGVILSIHPECRIVDITHDVSPGSILQAAAVILEAFPFFPQGTVHVAVVDPGVGSGRRAVVAERSGHFFVGPDNGIFWPLLEGESPPKVFELADERYFLPRISRTFHGRDIFAPVSAHIARGVDPRRMGPSVQDPVKLHVPKPYVRGSTLFGQVVRVDHFGNLITNIHRSDMESFLGEATPLIRIGKWILKDVKHIYAVVDAGDPLALYGGTYHLEIAVNSGRASEQLGLKEGRIIGTRVTVTRAET